MDRYLLDGHKLYWHLDRVRDWQEGRLIPPVYLEISPLAWCNHRCGFCGIDFAQEKSLRLEAPLLCERLAEMGRLGVRSVMFAGEGEPLLHPDFPAMVRAARQAGLDVGLTTNGSVGTSALWEELLPHLSWVKFSVDAGTAEVYARVHGVAASAFARTLESLRAAVGVKRRNGLGVTLGAQFLLVEENAGDVENALSLFSGENLDYFVLKPFSLHPQMLRKHDTAYSQESLDRIRQAVAAWQGRTSTALLFREEAASRYAEGRKTFAHCRALPFWGYISSRGDFYTCSVFLGDERFRTGNIAEETMESILFGERRRESLRFGAQDLDVNGICRLNCRMARINEFLEYLATPPEHVNFI